MQIAKSWQQEPLRRPIQVGLDAQLQAGVALQPKFQYSSLHLRIKVIDQSIKFKEQGFGARATT